MRFSDKNSGYWLPPALASDLQSFFDPVCSAIHRIFFSGKNVLQLEHRLSFIEIFDMFLALKLIDLVQPTSFSFSCKDGIDFGCISSAELFLFSKLMAQEPFDWKDWSKLTAILYGPAFLVRERVILHERFQRMAAALKVIEFVYQELGHAEFSKAIRQAFGPLYSKEMLA